MCVNKKSVQHNHIYLFVYLCLGGMKCPECEFIYGTNWELNRHLKSKHGLKLVEGTWEVKSLKLIFVIWKFKNCSQKNQVVNQIRIKQKKM